MNPVILFSQVADYHTNIEFKIHKVKTATNRTAKVVANVLNGLQGMIKKGMIEGDDYELPQKLAGVVNFFETNFPSWMIAKNKSESALLATLEQEYIKKHLPKDIAVSPILFGPTTWGVLSAHHPERSEPKQPHFE